MHKRIWNWLGSAVVVGVFGAYLIRYWPDIVAMHPTGTWRQLAGAMVLNVGSGFFQLLLFRAFLGYHGLTLNLAEAWRLFGLPQLGKYLPGKVASLAASTVLLKQSGLSVPHALAVETVFFGMNTVAGLVTGLLLFPPLANLMPWSVRVALLGTTVLGMAASCTPWAWQLVNLLLRRLGRTPLPRHPSGSAMVLIFVGLILRWGFCGVVFFALAVYLQPLALTAAPQVMSAIILSYFIGLFAVFAPAGLGVRETALVALLGGSAGPGFAVLFAVLSRVLFLANDVVFIGGAWIIQMRRNRCQARPPAAG